MLEINPLFKAADDKIVAVDCKMNLDDNALVRHADLASMRDVSEEDPTEVEAGKYNLNFVKAGWQCRMYGKWCRSCHGNNGYDKTERW